MNKAAKIGMIIWTILCFLGACGGLMNVAHKTQGQMSDAEAVGTGIGLFFWMLIWFFPTAIMGIIALVTKPKDKNTMPAQPGAPQLCAHCGKYYAGTADFCPLCGKPQKLDQTVTTH